MNAAPSASPFAARPDARALRAWSQAQQRSVRDMLHKLLLDWQLAWALGNPASEVHITAPEAPPLHGNDTPVHWRLEGIPVPDAASAAQRALQTALFGSEVHAPTASGAPPVIALEIAQAAWADWQQRLESALGAPLAGWPAEADETHSADRWSGTLCARLSWCGMHCLLQIPGPVVQRLLPPAPAPSRPAAASALVNLADALQGQRLSLQARLHNVTLTLGELEHLAPGDVVLLPHRLDTPLQLMGPREGLLCDAWLGQQAGRVALELSPLTTPA